MESITLIKQEQIENINFCDNGGANGGGSGVVEKGTWIRPDDSPEWQPYEGGVYDGVGKYLTSSQEEDLIEAIRCRPAIWDCQDAEYKNRILKPQLWLDVLMAANIPKTEENIRYAKRRWDSIRSAHIRSRKVPWNSEIPGQKSYKYSHLLSFLDDVNLSKMYRTNMNGDDDGGSGYGNGTEKCTNTSFDATNLATILQQSQTSSTQIKRKKQRIGDSDDGLKDFTNLNKRLCTELPMQISGFLQMLGATINTMPDEKKLPLMINILNLVNDETKNPEASK